MNAELLLKHYSQIADAPDAIARLRRFILDLAVRGKLVEQDPHDEAPHGALTKARSRLRRDAEAASRLRWKSTEPVQQGEVGKDLPHGWVAARVNDTALYINGLAFKPADWKRTGKPIIRIQNLTDPAKDFNYAEGNFPDEVIVRNGDILVSWSATLDAFQWSGGEGVLNQHIFRVIPASELTEPDFLLLLLRNAIREMSESEHAHGLVMSHINRGPFLNHIVLIPPRAEQRRIAEKFNELMELSDQLTLARAERDVGRNKFTMSTLAKLNKPDPEAFADDARFALEHLEPLTKRRDQIKQLRQAILNLAVRGELTAQDPNDEPATALMDEVAADRGNSAHQLGKILADVPFAPPSGWLWTSMNRILGPSRDISYGVIKLGPEPKSGGIPTLRCSDVRPGYIDLSGVRRVDPSIEGEYARTRLQGGEILINIRGTLGGVAHVPVELKGYNVAREVAVIPITQRLSGKFMVYLLLSSFFWDMIERNLRGIAYKGLNLGILREFPVPIPPIAEQHRIVAKVDELMALCEKLEASLAEGEQTRSKLLEAVLHEVLEPA